MDIKGYAVNFEIVRPKYVLTDEEISTLWHEAQEQPFRFARMLEVALRNKNEQDTR